MAPTSNDLVAKVCNALRREFPGLINFDTIVPSNCSSVAIKRILTYINNKQIKYPSHLFRYVNRNKSKLESYFKYSKPSNVVMRDEDMIISDLLKEGRIEMRNINSIRDKDNVFYQNMCKQLRKKDNFKNRLKIYYHCKSFFKINEGTNDKGTLPCSEERKKLIFHSTPQKDNVHVKLISDLSPINKIEQNDYVSFTKKLLYPKVSMCHQK